MLQRALRFLAVLAACLCIQAATAAPVLNVYFLPGNVIVGDPVQLEIDIWDDNGASIFSGAIADAAWTYSPGLMNSAISYNDCGTAILGATSLAVTGISVARFSSCTIIIDLTPPSPGTYSVTLADGGYTGSTGPSVGDMVATFGVALPPIVTNTNDSGAGSLRAAIDEMNTICIFGGATVTFAIDGTGPQTIAPLTPLPPITCYGLAIDGLSQPGARGSDDAVGPSQNNADLRIVLDGSGCPRCDGLTIGVESAATINGLVIRSFGGAGIRSYGQLSSSQNFIGVDPDGKTAHGNGIGIAGESGSFVDIDRSLITGNGVGVLGGDNAQVHNSLIGGDRDGNPGIGNGVGFRSNVGGGYRIQANYIRHNTGRGIVVPSNAEANITGNSIWGNGGTGIDVGDDGFTAPSEIAPYPFNPPFITSAIDKGSYATVIGYVKTGANNGDVFLEFYDNPSPSVPGITEGRRLIGGARVRTDGTGYAPFTVNTDDTGAPKNISALALVDMCGEGCLKASEFSVSVPVTPPPPALITYSFSGTVTGTLNGVAFTDAPIMITAIGDTNAITPGAIPCGPVSNVTFDIAGVGAGTTAEVMGIFINGNVIGLQRAVCGGADWVDLTSPALANYLLDTNIGPVIGSPLIQYAVASSAGTLDITTSNITVFQGSMGGVLPAVTLSPASLGFGAQVVNTSSASQQVTLMNSGTAVLTIASLNTGANFSFTTTCGSSLGVGASCTVDITFTPTVAATISTALLVTTNAPGSPHRVDLSGTGTATPAPLVTLSPTSLAFSSQLIGIPSATQPVTLMNSGNASLAISSISISGDFSQANACPASLGPGASCIINVKFTPTVAGARFGTLSVASNAAGTPHTVSLTGTGATPAAIASITPGTLSFAARTVSTTSTGQTITLANSGTLALAISSIRISGDFAFTSGCGATLAPGSSCTIDVTFTPLVVAPRTGTLTIVDNAAGSPHTVALDGVGLSTAVPVADLSSTLLDFPAEPVGSESDSQLLTVTNSGNAPLTFTSIDVSGEFSVVPAVAGVTAAQCPITLAPGASCEIHVTFHPLGPNLREGALRIVTNAGIVTVRLIGTGQVPAPPQLSLAASLAFGNQPVGTRSAGRSLAIRNTSELLATITSLSTTGDFDVSDTCTTIPAGATCSPLVTFQPSAIGPRTGTLTVRTLRDANPYTVSLSGTGEENRLPVLHLSASGIGFGNNFMGHAVTSDLVLQNTGTAPLVISSIVTGGAFFTDTACITTLVAGASCTVHVTFLASLPGSQSASVDISSNASGSPHHVSLSGTGCFLPTPSRARLGGLLCGP